MDGSGVSTTIADTPTQESPLYDLGGRRINCPTRGIAIRNGRKMVVK